MSVPGIMVPGAFSHPAPGELQQQQEQERQDEQRVSRFEGAVQRAGLQTPDEVNIETLLREAGADMEAYQVKSFIDSVPSDMDPQLLQFYVAQLAAKYPAVPVTRYAEAFEASGFGPEVFEHPTAGAELIPRKGKPGLVPGGLGGAEDMGRNWTQQPDTGWIVYKSGVLVNPDDGSVYFQPASNAPGSPNWLRTAANWGPEKVAAERQRLFDAGYLSKEQAKVKSVDQVFLEALRAYHVSRYQNFGKSVPLDLAAAGGAGEEKFRLTARDFQAQIRNDVREQYRRVLGQDPTDAEVEDWSSFVTNIAAKAQRAFARKGASPSSALSLAATEAEERLVERLEGSPQAEFLTESAQENTRLRDGLAQAARVTAAFG